MKQLKRALFFAFRYICSLLSCFYLFTIGAIFTKNRNYINRISSHFGFAIIRPKVPIVKLSEIFDVQLPVKIVEIMGVDGNINLTELSILNLFVKTFKPATIFEIGTFDGRTALNLAINSLPETKIYSIDLPKESSTAPALAIGSGDKVYVEKDVTGIRYRNKDETTFPEKNKITQLYGDSATFDFTPYLNKMDMVFIDGAHSYEYVLNDSKIAMKLLRNGKGVIIWHDYDPLSYGVTKALNALQSKHPELNLIHIEGTSLVCLILR